jgi:hypothetical protein
VATTFFAAFLVARAELAGGAPPYYVDESHLARDDALTRTREINLRDDY